jgi:hypothetical protein
MYCTFARIEPIFGDIPRGGLEKLNEAGVALRRGHSVSGLTNNREFSGPHDRNASSISSCRPADAAALQRKPQTAE